MSEIAKHFGIKVNTLMFRINKGMTLEEAIKYGIPVIEKRTVFEGTDREFAGNMTEIANHFHTNISRLEDRLKRGYTLEEAIDLPLVYIKQKDLKYKNFNGSLREICKKFNKNYIKVYNKLKSNHTLEWSIESTIEPYNEDE